MNFRITNTANPNQNIKEYKRVLCVCSAGLLRSPTAAWVLSNDPWNYNTRAVGVAAGFSLIVLDEVHLHWADEIVTMDQEETDVVLSLLQEYQINKPVINLNIPDEFEFRNPVLVSWIKESYNSEKINPSH